MSEVCKELEVFGEEIKKASEVLPDEASREFISRNVLTNLLYWDPKGYPDRYTFLIFLQLSPRNEGYTFDDVLKELYKVMGGDKEEYKKYVERSLDILLDIGLLVAKWSKRDKNLVRTFIPRSELGLLSKEHRDNVLAIQGVDLRKPIFETEEDKTSVLLPLLIHLWMGFPAKYSFFRKVLDINLYLAHIADIIDPDHPKFKLKLKNTIDYKKFWNLLRELTDKIYESNIRFSHYRKKLAIYDLEDWIKEKIREGKITQCKMRYLLDFDEENFDKNLPIRNIIIVPIVNFEIEEDKLPSTEEREIICTLMSWDFVKRLLLESLKKTKDELEVKEIEFGWKWLKDVKEDEYEKIKDELEEELKEFEYELSEMGDIYEGIQIDLYEKLVLNEIKDKIRKIEVDLCKRITEEIERENPSVLVALARKGDTIINHLKKIAEMKAYKDTEINELFNNFGEKISKIEIINDFVFVKKINDFLEKKILIFDDAIDEGRNLEKILYEIRNKVDEENWRKFKNNLKIFAYIVNENNRNKINEKLRNFGLNYESLSVGYWLS